MSKSISTIVLIAICCLTALSQVPVAKKSALSDEEYKFLSEVYCRTNPRVFSTQMMDGKISLEKAPAIFTKIRKYYTDAKIPNATNALIKDFNEKNSSVQLLENKFTNCNAVLLTKADIAKIFATGDGWKKFNEKYPKSGGISRFSRIAFSPDRNQAFLYHDYSCGWLCADGSYYFFVKENGEWVKKIKDTLWVS